MSNPSSSRPLTGHLPYSLSFCLFIAEPDEIPVSRRSLAQSVSATGPDYPNRTFPSGSARNGQLRYRSNSCSLSIRWTRRLRRRPFLPAALCLLFPNHSIGLTTKWLRILSIPPNDTYQSLSCQPNSSYQAVEIFVIRLAVFCILYSWRGFKKSMSSVSSFVTHCLTNSERARCVLFTLHIGDSNIWKFGDPGILIFGNFEIRHFEYLLIRRFGNLDVWKLQYLNNCRF